MEQETQSSEHDVSALAERGAALTAAGRAQEAAAVLSVATARDPSHPDAALRLGQALQRCGALLDACCALRSARELDAAGSASALAACLVDRGTAAKSRGHPALAHSLYSCARYASSEPPCMLTFFSRPRFPDPLRFAAQRCPLGRPLSPLCALQPGCAPIRARRRRLRPLLLPIRPRSPAQIC